MQDYLSLKITTDDGLATVEITNGKVNAIDTQLSEDLLAAFAALDADETVAGVVLTGRPGCFCAGLDIKHMASFTDETLRKFWHANLGALRVMIRFSKPFVCAVTGFAPAGGTILTLTADYRIMATGSKHTVGMNEFNMSLQIPRTYGDIYTAYLGEHGAWTAVQQAAMYTAEEAIKVGLVDEVLPENEVLPRALKYCRKLMNVYAPVYATTKRYQRKSLLACVAGDIPAEVDEISKNLDDPRFKMMLEMFVASLSK
jgi:3,2-trans-enoyl-CoA isomerase